MGAVVALDTLLAARTLWHAGRSAAIVADAFPYAGQSPPAQAYDPQDEQQVQALQHGRGAGVGPVDRFEVGDLHQQHAYDGSGQQPRI